MVRTIKSSVKHAARLAARTAKDEADDLERELDQEPKDLERQQQNELHLSCPFLLPPPCCTREKKRAVFLLNVLKLHFAFSSRFR